MSQKLRLIPSMDVATLGTANYIFDRSAEASNIVFVPTQRISKPLFSVIKKIKQTYPPGQGQALDEIKALFPDPADQARVTKLVAAGYLEAVADEFQNVLLEQSAETPAAPAYDHLSYFRNNVLTHYVKRRSFFNLPTQISNSEVDVGVIGIPISSVTTSDGTIHAPDRLRQGSQKSGFWFDFYRDGVYTELGCDGSEPRLMCRDVLLKDFGDLGQQSRTVGELFNEINHFIENELISHRIRPIFIGGDHAITFPVVDSLIKHYSNLVLLHLDAHNDLYYTERVDFSHAGPIQGLLLHSGLAKVMSFGLRTMGDPRVASHLRLTTQEKIHDKVSMYSLGAMRRRLSDRESFLQHLVEEVGEDTPCYLTIDLDVLSADAIAGQVSTPAGHGLEFHELYEFVDLAMTGLNVIGCDVVEFNADTRNTSNDSLRDTIVLLMQLADGLAAVSNRYRSSRPVEDEIGYEDPAPVVQPLGSQKRLRRTRKSSVDQPSLFPRQVERRPLKSLTYDTFLKEFALPGNPLVITDCDESAATSNWSLEYFLERISRESEIDVNTFRVPFEHGTATLERFGFWETLASMRQRSRIELTGLDERYNIVDWNFAFTNPELLRDYTVPLFFDMDLSRHFGFSEHALNWIYIGEAGTGSLPHIDVSNSSAWLLLAKGAKHWRFVHGDATGYCGHAGNWVDLFAPDLDQYPEMGEIEGFDLIQAPGEIVWAPPGCLHGIRNLESTIAVTHNYMDLTNLGEVYNARQTNRRSGVTHDSIDLARLVALGVTNLQEKGLESALKLLLPRLAESLVEQGTQVAKFESEIAESLAQIARLESTVL